MSDLPLAFRLGVLTVLLGVFVYVVATDRSEALALALLGVIGGAIALDQNARNGKG